MKKRSPVGVFILSLITFGIYDIYWLVVTKKELNDKTHTQTPSIWVLFAPFLFIIAAFVLIFVQAVTASNNSLDHHTTTATGVVNFLVFIVYLLSFLVILPITFYWFFKFSKAVDEYTNGKMSTGVTFLLLWLLHLLGVAIVQDTFNDMIDAGIQPASLPAMPGQPVASAATPVTNPLPPEHHSAGHHQHHNS